MDWLTGIAQAIDYVETHLTEEIDYTAVARTAACSGSYFQRIFGILCGMSLGEYIRSRRLTLAGSELASGHIRVIDAALKYGYESPESFTRAFVRFHGITPSEARRDGSALRSLSRLSVKIIVSGGTVMDYKLEHKVPFFLLEKVEAHSSTDDENTRSIPDFWTRARQDGTLAQLRQMGDPHAPLLGICHSSEGTSFEYGIGIPCSQEAPVPQGMRKSLISDTEWLIFDCTGAMPDAMQKLWHSIMSEFFPSSPCQPAGHLDMEVYPEGSMDSPDYKSQIWIPIKKS